MTTIEMNRYMSCLLVVDTTKDNQVLIKKASSRFRKKLGRPFRPTLFSHGMSNLIFFQNDPTMGKNDLVGVSGCQEKDFWSCGQSETFMQNCFAPEIRSEFKKTVLTFGHLSPSFFL